MARSEYVWIVVCNDGDLEGFTVKWEMVRWIENTGTSVDFILRVPDGIGKRSPYKRFELSELIPQED